MTSALNRLLLRVTLALHKLTVRRLRDEFPGEYRDIELRSGIERGELRTVRAHSQALVNHDFLLDAADSLLA